ncbi:ABC transporter permease [Ectothiorhodospira magna]|uniref:ABC transporter permease n=1 Tax=Ectothiorhodospira magna TaxID=867345 RepID=UPI00138FF7E8|nr:ABC transporter permease [Ectothiorhodospira magna]
MLIRLNTLRHMLPVFVWRELREQYAGTRLGLVWNLLQPAMMVFVYWWVFGYIWAIRLPGLGEGGDVPFILFLLCGLLPWLAFSDALNRSANAVLGRADVVRHGNFPVLIFPLARVLAAHLVFIPIILGFILFLWLSGWQRDPVLVLWVLPLLGLQCAFAIGLGLLLSALSVYVRDVPHVLSMVLLGLFFTAPILYPLAQVPEALQTLIWANPFTVFAEGYHRLLLESRWPGWGLWLAALTYAAAALVAGGLFFQRLRPGFADVL